MLWHHCWSRTGSRRRRRNKSSVWTTETSSSATMAPGYSQFNLSFFLFYKFVSHSFYFHYLLDLCQKFLYKSSKKEAIFLIFFSLIYLQYVKCGFAGENFPTSVFPCVVGRPLLRYEESLIEQELKVGDWLKVCSFMNFIYWILHCHWGILDFWLILRFVSVWFRI